MYVDFNLGRYKDFSGLFKIYYVYGNVISSNNKTYVKITSVYRRIDIWLRYFSILLLLILVPILIVLRDVFSEHSFPPAVIISIIPFIHSIIILNKSISVYKKKGLEFVELAKNEIKKRIQNTIQWEN